MRTPPRAGADCRSRRASSADTRLPQLCRAWAGSPWPVCPVAMGRAGLVVCRAGAQQTHAREADTYVSLLFSLISNSHWYTRVRAALNKVWCLSLDVPLLCALGIAYRL